MSGLAKDRLVQERKHWRKNRPFGFAAKPKKKDGVGDLFTWECSVPGKKDTAWEGGDYPVTIIFDDDFPSKPPKCSFPKNFFHPNIYPSGTVCLSILNEEADWRPTIGVKQILLGIQELLTNPNDADPAQTNAFDMYISDREKYDEKIKKQAVKYNSS